MLPIPSPFGQERVDTPVPQAPPPLLRVPPDGELFREQGRAEGYLIRDGALLHIPNPYVMDALGLDWNAVQLVPAGSLDHIPRDSSWDPLAEGTPGSVVHVPTDVGVGANAGKVYWPLRLATTKRHVAWGQEVRTIELRGWISPPPPGANAADPDFTYELEIDVEWVLACGIDVNALVKVGNILQLGSPQAGITDRRAWCATPSIKMEIVGFPPKGQRDRAFPPDWTHEMTPPLLLDAADAGAANNHPVKWPFEPTAPPPSSKMIMGGEYVRVFGAIVSDKRHDDDVEFRAFRDVIDAWATGYGNNEDDPARWTEVHPPDWIEIIDPAPPVTQTFRGVTVLAPGTFPWRPTVVSVLDVDIPAPPKPQPPQPGMVLRYREFVGPETDTATIVEGNANLSGAA